MIETQGNFNRLQEIFEARLGRITSVYQENQDNPNDKRMFCSIEEFPGGSHNNVPLWGGGFDFETEYPHGFFVPPRENQLIIILYLHGHFQNPLACIPIPHPYDQTYQEKYYDLVESVNDISLFHFSGTRIIMRENGDIDFQKRIEESANTFVNHTLKMQFEYDDNNDIRKKIVTDVDNDVIIELTTEDVTIEDTAGNKFVLHSKSGEETVEITDKAGQTFTMDSSTGAEKVEIVDKASQKITMTAISGSNKIVVERGATQKMTLSSTGNKFENGSQTIEQGTASTKINGTSLEVL